MVSGTHYYFETIEKYEKRGKYLPILHETRCNSYFFIRPSLSKKFGFICFNKSPLKIMKNAFYFLLNALFVLKIFKYLSCICGPLAKRLMLRLISKFMMLQTGQHIIVIHILPNISRIKGNQTMEFGQLTEHNMRNIIQEKSYIKYGGEASPRPFYKKLKLSVSLDQQSDMLYSLFLLYVQVEV